MSTVIRFLFILCIFNFSSLATADGPAVVASSYTEKNLDFLDVGSEVVILNFDFDQDIYFQQECPQRAQDPPLEPTIILPCCNSTLTDNCYTAEANEGDCFDATADREEIYTFPDSINGRYEFQVANPQSCHSIMFGTKMEYGILNVKMFTRLNAFINGGNPDFYTAFIGANSIFVCCSKIRTYNPAWNGKLYVRVEPSTDAKWTSQLLNSPIVSATDYFHTNRLEIHCANGYNYTRCIPQLTGGCWPLAPAKDDPPYYFINMASGRRPDGEIIGRRLSLSLAFTTSSFVSGTSSTTLYILDRAVLDPSNQCYVNFPHLVNSNGEPAQRTPFPAEKVETCSQTVFASRLDGFLTDINDLSGKFNGSVAEMVVQDFISLLANTWSKEWTSCISFISKGLLETNVEKADFIDSTFCPFFDPTDPRYLYDPCCNVRQQEQECCRVRDMNVEDFHSTVVSANAVAQQCKRPKCITETINDYLALQQSTADRVTGCTGQSSSTIGSAVLTQTIGCSSNLFETSCLASSDCTTVCVPDGFCAVPCTVDEDCLSGSCSLTAEIDGKNASICKMISALDVNNVPFDRINAQFLRCIESTVDPVLYFYIKRLVGASPSDDVNQVADLVLKMAGKETCFGLGEYLFEPLSIVTNLTTQEECDSSQSCNWAPCESNANANCNNRTCTEAVGSEYFCGFCLYDQCIEVSSFPVCKYTALPSEQNCTYYGGLYNGINPAYPKCIRPSSLDCYPPQFCEQSTGPCSPICYVPAYTSAATCDGQTVGTQTASFKTWTRSGTTYGICTVPVTTLDACLSVSPDTRFWPGTDYSADSSAQSIFNTQGVCTFAGMCNLDVSNLSDLEFSTLNKYVKTAATCSESCNKPPTKCTNCTTAETCDANGRCNQNVGCYTPFSDKWADSPCPEGTVWTAMGCIYDPWVIGSPADCVSPNVWHDAPTTRAECEEIKVCVEPKIITAVTFTTKDLSARPNHISFKNESECTRCGGTIQPYWTWKAGEWRPGQFVPFEWRKREMKHVNKWTNLIDQATAQQLVNKVIAKRYADVLSSEMLCRYGQLQSAASEIICDCASDGSNCSTSVSAIRDPPVALIQFCTYAKFNQTFSRGYLYAENPSTDLGCAPVRVGVVPISQFNSRQTITLSSVSLSSSRDAQDGQERFYKNSNNIVVGEVLGDGLSIDFLGREIQGVQACIFFPDPSTSRLPGITKFSIFSVDRNATGLKITVNETYDASEGYHCVNLVDMAVGKTFFTIALVDSWQDTLFSSTLTEGELALIAIGIVFYLIALFASIYHFAVSIATRDTKKPLLTQSRIALGLLIIFLIIRVLYLILFVTGTFKNSQSADVIFSELPALVFLNIYCIIVLRWAALYHFGLKDGTGAAKQSFRRLKPVLYVFDALLGAAFITLLIVYFSLSDQITITCESDDVDVNAATPKQIVAIVYKAFFAVVCIILSIAFLVYGSRIIRSSTSFTARSLDRAEQLAIKKRKRDVLNKIVITVVCTLCLLGQAANLLRASATNEPGIYILIFLYPIELLPSIMFIIILKKVPFFYRASLFGSKKLLNINRSSWRVSTNQKKRNTVYGNMNAKLMAEEESEDAVPMSETFQDESNLAFSEIQVSHEIGTGNYGKVNLGTWKGSQVALKRSKAFERTEFVREAKLVMTLPPHQNVVRTLGLTNDGFNLMLVMEFCNGGSLDVKLFDLPDPISEQEKHAILIGIAQGMLYLHQNKIIHRDLAARNILLDNNVPKVADFGLSRKVDDILRNNTTRNNVGPLRWMAPEALRDGTYSAKTDVWSFGIVMFEVLAQSEPHVEEDPLFIGIKIRDGAFFPRLPATSTSDQVLRNLMEQCCRKDPNERPDFNNIYHVLVNRWNELYGKM